MAKCLDCEKETKTKSGICPRCKLARRVQKEQDKKNFRQGVESVWQRMEDEKEK